MSTTKSNHHAYGIGAVAKLTGLTHQTIRAWERRYGAVKPRRSDNGRREYSGTDVDRFGLLKRLTDQGVAISHIASDSDESLRERAREMSEIATDAPPSTIRIAILGDFLPGHLARLESLPPPLDIAVSDINRLRFEADLHRGSADVVVLEVPILDEESISQIKSYLKICSVARGIIVYTFGRSSDVEAARKEKLLVLRAPVSADGLSAAVVQSHAKRQPNIAPASTGSRLEASEAPTDGMTSRRFTQQQLANLAGSSTSIECECPQHLAQLVNELSAFEVYSAQCTHRNEDDAALHAYLHQTTARARALMEEALERVAKAEGLSY